MVALVALFALRPDRFPLSPNDRVVRELALLFGLGSLAYVWRDALPVSLRGCVAVRWWRGIPADGRAARCSRHSSRTSCWSPRTTRARSGPRSTALGDYSYGLYVYSFPLQQTLMQLWPGARARRPLRASLPLGLAVAAVSWHATRAARTRTKIEVRPDELRHDRTDPA